MCLDFLCKSQHGNFTAMRQWYKCRLFCLSDLCQAFHSISLVPWCSYAFQENRSMPDVQQAEERLSNLPAWPGIWCVPKNAKRSSWSACAWNESWWNVFKCTGVIWICWCFVCLILGLPIQVRDAGLSLKDEMPKSDVNKEYYTQNMEREVRKRSCNHTLCVWMCKREEWPGLS